MNRLDIIRKVKPAAIKVMQDRRVLASLLIAESILISEPYLDIVANNPLRFKNPKTDLIIKFNSVEDCFNFFIDSGINKNGQYNIIGNYNYKSLIKSLKLDQTNENSLIEIIESYKLNDIDSQVLNEMYSGKKTVVEIDSEPFIDFYKVKKGTTEVFNSFNKEEAIKECKKYYGYSVLNSKGDIIYTNIISPEVKAKMELQEKIVVAPKLGTKIYLKNTNLYETPNSKVPLRAITGFYYISDSKKYNGRYMITNKPENVGDKDYILGYINKQ